MAIHRLLQNKVFFFFSREELSMQKVHITEKAKVEPKVMCAVYSDAQQCRAYCKLHTEAPLFSCTEKEVFEMGR